MSQIMNIICESNIYLLLYLIKTKNEQNTSENNNLIYRKLNNIAFLKNQYYFTDICYKQNLNKSIKGRNSGDVY